MMKRQLLYFFEKIFEEFIDKIKLGTVEEQGDRTIYFAQKLISDCISLSIYSDQFLFLSQLAVLNPETVHSD